MVNQPNARMRPCMLYIVHRTSYVVHRTSYIVLLCLAPGYIGGRDKTGLQRDNVSFVRSFVGMNPQLHPSQNGEQPERGS